MLLPVLVFTSSLAATGLPYAPLQLLQQREQLCGTGGWSFLLDGAQQLDKPLLSDLTLFHFTHQLLRHGAGISLLTALTHNLKEHKVQTKWNCGAAATFQSVDGALELQPPHIKGAALACPTRSRHRTALAQSELCAHSTLTMRWCSQRNGNKYVLLPPVPKDTLLLLLSCMWSHNCASSLEFSASVHAWVIPDTDAESNKGGQPGELLFRAQSYNIQTC